MIRSSEARIFFTYFFSVTILIRYHIIFFRIQKNIFRHFVFIPIMRLREVGHLENMKRHIANTYIYLPIQIGCSSSTIDGARSSRQVGALAPLAPPPEDYVKFLFFETNFTYLFIWLWKFCDTSLNRLTCVTLLMHICFWIFLKKVFFEVIFF